MDRLRRIVYILRMNEGWPGRVIRRVWTGDPWEAETGREYLEVRAEGLGFRFHPFSFSPHGNIRPSRKKSSDRHPNRPAKKSGREKWSGRPDSNRRPPAPKAGALARLRYAPSQSNFLSRYPPTNQLTSISSRPRPAAGSPRPAARAGLALRAPPPAEASRVVPTPR